MRPLLLILLFAASFTLISTAKAEDQSPHAFARSALDGNKQLANINLGIILGVESMIRRTQPECTPFPKYSRNVYTQMALTEVISHKPFSKPSEDAFEYYLNATAIALYSLSGCA